MGNSHIRPRPTMEVYTGLQLQYITIFLQTSKLGEHCSNLKSEALGCVELFAGCKAITSGFRTAGSMQSSGISVWLSPDLN